MIEIAADVHARLLELAGGELERGGLVFTDEGRFVLFGELPNIAPVPTHQYEAHPLAVLGLAMAAYGLGRGLSIGAEVHTHPRHEATPSTGDRRFFREVGRSYPGAVFLIVGTDGVRAWTPKSVELELQLISDVAA